MIKRVVLLVLDSVGAGELPDAGDYGDIGSNTLGNISRAIGGLKMPNLGRLGLGNIIRIEGVPPAKKPEASYGRMAEKSAGKDTTTGHWEMTGLILKQPFPVYPNGFPADFIKLYEKKIGRGVLGNKAASGTVIIEELGAEHMKTGQPIVYTSADSVFQVAAREMLVGEHAVGRVIARPFEGKPGGFRRTVNRHDFSLKPVGATVLDFLSENGVQVTAVGKIKDIFAGQGVAIAVPTKGNTDGMEKTLQLIKSDNTGLIFTNLVDFDMLYGHRNNPRGYGDALEDLDRWFPELLEALKEDDVLIITADHGCDPTTPSTDHSREYVPLLVYGVHIQEGIDLGVRESFSDIAATVAEIFGLKFGVGQSFWRRVDKG
jgi:phosphopentomutase